MAFAEIAGTRLFYTDDGAGDPVLLFVHGYSCDSHDWSWQLPHFVRDHRVIAVDLRGHGRSSAPASGYRAVDLATDLAGLLHQLRVERVVALGHSLGGIVVSCLAVEHPELVAGLVCVDPAYLLPAETASLADALTATDDVVGFVQQLFSGFDSAAWSPALRTWILRRAQGVPPHVLRQALESQLTGLVLYEHSAPYLARRQCPVLTIYADPARVDVETPLFADQRSRAEAWAGAGHWLHQEQPEAFNAEVDSWLASRL